MAGVRHLDPGDPEPVTDAILFDFNGVLVDDEEQHRAALTRVAERLGLTVTRAWY